MGMKMGCEWDEHRNGNWNRDGNGWGRMGMGWEWGTVIAQLLLII